MTDFSNDTVTEVTHTDTATVDDAAFKQNFKAAPSKPKLTRAEKKKAKEAEEKKALEIQAAATEAIQLSVDLASNCTNLEKADQKHGARYKYKRYQLIAKAHAIVEKIEVSGYAAEIKTAMRADLRERYNIKTQENSSLANVVVRYVTNTNRKNAFMYARVVEAAQAQGVESSALVSFIVANKGIANIKGEQTPTQKAREKQANAQKDFEHGMARYGLNRVYDKIHRQDFIGTLPISNAKLNDHWDSRGDARFVYLFAEIKGNNLNVVDLVPAVTRTHEDEFGFFYALLENMRMESKYGFEADKKIMQKIAGYFAAYNCLMQIENKALRFDAYGNPSNTSGEHFEFNREFMNLIAITNNAALASNDPTQLNQYIEWMHH
jgi:hypothetical protein